MTLKQKRANRTQRANEPKLIGLSNEYKHAWLLVGYANERVKKLPGPRELSRNQPILCLDVILQHDWPIEQCHLILGFSLAGKRRVHVLIFLSIS